MTVPVSPTTGRHSRRYRELLLSLVFTPAAANELLATVAGPGHSPQGRQPHPLGAYRRLARLTGPASDRIDDALAARLGPLPDDRTLCALATRWSRARAPLSIDEVARLLFATSTADCALLLGLAHVIADELSLRAVRAMVPAPA